MSSPPIIIVVILVPASLITCTETPLVHFDGSSASKSGADSASSCAVRRKGRSRHPPQRPRTVLSSEEDTASTSGEGQKRDAVPIDFLQRSVGLDVK